MHGLLVGVFTMKLNKLTDEELMAKRNSILKQMETARGLTARDLQVALERIDKERVKRAWERRK